MVTTAIDGAGTSEAHWRPWLAQQAWTTLELAPIVGAERVVVLAAHPDDEVLAIGGLLRRLAACGSSIVVIWATDGEASHPESTTLTRSHLATLRRAESLAALRDLAVFPTDVHHLGLPDSDLASHEDALVAALRQVLRDDDVVLAPWRGDGHPDHEVLGHAAATLSDRLIEYPIWMWHWATVGDGRVPWHRARSVPSIDVIAKSTAIDAFVTQVRPIGPSPADGVVLPSYVLERFRRRSELVFQ